MPVMFPYNYKPPLFGLNSCRWINLAEKYLLYSDIKMNVSSFIFEIDLLCKLLFYFISIIFPTHSHRLEITKKKKKKKKKNNTHN